MHDGPDDESPREQSKAPETSLEPRTVKSQGDEQESADQGESSARLPLGRKGSDSA